jgi:hypothetical protein
LVVCQLAIAHVNDNINAARRKTKHKTEVSFQRHWEPDLSRTAVTFRQPLRIIEKVAMIAQAIRFLQARRAVPTDFKQPVGELDRMFALHLLQSFADRFCNRLRQALSREPRQLPGQLVGIFIFIFDAHAHGRYSTT